jgi:hypothetical protein
MQVRSTPLVKTIVTPGYRLHEFSPPYGRVSQVAVSMQLQWTLLATWRACMRCGAAPAHCGACDAVSTLGKAPTPWSRHALASFRVVFFLPIEQMTLCFHTVPEFAGVQRTRTLWASTFSTRTHCGHNLT